MSAGHRCFDHVQRRMNAATDRQRCFYASRKYCCSAKAQIEFGGSREFHMAPDFKLQHVKVDLVKTSEENYSVRSRRIDLQSKVCKGREKRRQLHRHGNPELSFDFPKDLKHLTLNLRGIKGWVAGGVVEMKFNRVSTSLLHETSVREPAARRAAVE